MRLSNCSPAVLLVLLLSTTAQAAEHCVILQYHHVSADTPAATSVTPARFQEHLDFLKAGAFKVLALEQVVDKLQRGMPLPEKCVALTIDDAYLSAYTEAWPRARRYGFPLTVFVSTRGVDAGLGAFMDWAQIRAMAAGGVSIQNHSAAHDHLVRVRPGERTGDWQQRVAVDIGRAQDRIKTQVGRAPALFAYPYGEYNPDLARLVRGMGLVGFGQHSGPAWKDADFAALPRFPMGGSYAGMQTFAVKAASLPLPIIAAEPRDPLVDLDQWRPVLTLRFKPGSYRKALLTCFVNGSPEVDYEWPEEQPDTVHITPRIDLQPGRNRYNCTMPAGVAGRFHWYSHNWIRRHADGGWYREP